MGDATFLLLINLAIGLVFAGTFLGITARSRLALGRWCAAGFLAAAGAVTVEALARDIASVRVVSTLSFGLLLASLLLIAAGLLRHYRPGTRIGWIAGIGVAYAAFNSLVIVDLPRGSWAQAFAYQLPFAVVLGAAAGLVLRVSPRRTIDLVLALVLALCAVQFATKAVLIPMLDSAVSVRDYITSSYIRYSQTAGGILSLMLGASLVGLLVTEVLAENARRLERDELSGVLTRAAFLNRARRTLGAVREPVRCALVMCDLDHFKAINDTYGHAAGDDVIRHFGGILRQRTGAQGLCGRIGGEEFCMLLTHVRLDDVTTYVEDIRGLAAEMRHGWQHDDLRLTASFGIAMVEPEETMADAMRRADRALYDAKAQGRDRYRVAWPDMPLHQGLRRKREGGRPVGVEISAQRPMYGNRSTQTNCR